MNISVHTHALKVIDSDAEKAWALSNRATDTYNLLEYLSMSREAVTQANI